ncbi:DUF3592 domain-containing protein [Dyella sp.]|jgi:hypothetical protein|uniref:DUF3592 domain-containing protein n=1 Tax=Dyella sp. TaxID=1869338 RepID=UPI002D78DEBB|nr:DUF3592 domain-containing protein [Dyella sp.]HET6432521.1 DUF3592 domain-containing protein [Dyella sp.]
MPHLRAKKNSAPARHARSHRRHEAVVCAGIAIALLVAGWLKSVHERKEDATWPVAYGKVVAFGSACGYPSTGGRHGECRSFPWVQFTTSEGRSVTFRSHVGQREPAFEQGQGVRVRYDPRSPDVRDSAFIVDYGLRVSTFLYRLALAAAAVTGLLALMNSGRTDRKP